MPSPVDNGTSQRQAETLGLIEGLKVGSVFPFGGMNLSDSRIGIGDHEFSWLENYVHIGKGRLRTAYDRGLPIYTVPAGKQIVCFFWFTINGSTNCAVFLADGTAVQVSDTGATTTISATPGLFYTGGQLPYATQWGTTYLLICNNITQNSYWVWDGTVLYAAGGLGPFTPGDLLDAGSGYASAPAVTFFGGSGSGAAGVATVVNGSVVAITVTNPGTGYLPSDSSVQVAFAGGGSDSSAILTAVLSGGTVDHVEIISGGSGYTSAPTVGFTGGGGGSGATAIAVITAGAVTGVVMTNGGSGYTSSPGVTFTGGAGAGASAISVLTSGSVTSITVVNGGSGFTGTPLLTISGGGGTGATATAILTAGAISSAEVTAGGSGFTSPPSIVVQTGFNRAAAAQIEVMPFGISGTDIETFQSRAWVAAPFQIGPQSTAGNIELSAPGSFTDFATSDGGLLFQNSDGFLRKQYTVLHQSNGYLYTVGDSSVGVISNVQTAGNPTSTTFNNQNVDPQTGSSWRDSCQDYARTILFGNPFGVFGVYGGAVTKVSKQIDPLFDKAVFPPVFGALVPSAAVHEAFAQRLYLLLMTITDPFTGQPRNVMVGWDEAEWAVFSQSATLTYISTQEVASNPKAWGTDGAALFPLLAAPSPALAKTFQTKYFGGEAAFIVEQAYGIYLTVQNLYSVQPSITFTSTTVDAVGVAMPVSLPPYMEGEVTTQGGSFEMEENPVAFPAPVGQVLAFGTGVDPPVAGVGVGLTMVTMAADYELHNLQLGYKDITATL